MTELVLPQQAVSRGSLFVAAFSTVVEWYDFTQYLYFDRRCAV